MLSHDRYQKIYNELNAPVGADQCVCPGSAPATERGRTHRSAPTRNILISLAIIEIKMRLPCSKGYIEQSIYHANYDI